MYSEVLSLFWRVYPAKQINRPLLRVRIECIKPFKIPFFENINPGVSVVKAFP